MHRNTVEDLSIFLSHNYHGNATINRWYPVWLAIEEESPIIKLSEERCMGIMGNQPRWNSHVAVPPCDTYDMYFIPFD